MNTINALKEIAWQVSIEEFMDDENEQELINRMRNYINLGHEELGLDPVVIECAENATDEQIISAINEYIEEMNEENEFNPEYNEIYVTDGNGNLSVKTIAW